MQSGYLLSLGPVSTWWFSPRVPLVGTPTGCGQGCQLLTQSPAVWVWSISLAQADVLVTRHGQTALRVAEKHLQTGVITLDTASHSQEPAFY